MVDMGYGGWSDAENSVQQQQSKKARPSWCFSLNMGIVNFLSDEKRKTQEGTLFMTEI